MVPISKDAVSGGESEIERKIRDSERERGREAASARKIASGRESDGRRERSGSRRVRRNHWAVTRRVDPYYVQSPIDKALD
jgi:hypothetical protein